MAKCSSCSKTIIFGGKKSGEYRFCNDTCAAYAPVLHTADELPDEEVHKVTSIIHQGDCPKCSKQNGPVDVHTSHHIWSAILISSYKDVPEVTCKSCATKRQLLAFTGALIFGWWGFPHGIVGTPIQLFKNIKGMLGGPSSSQPSENLKRMVRINMAEEKLSN